MKKQPTKIKVITLLILFLVAACLVFVGPIMSNVENPKYEVISSVENIQIRRYAPMIVAEVEIEGSREESIRAGFRLLANYIFGDNTRQQKISMTAPVQQEVYEKIAMTAPVQQQMVKNTWKISFVMPSNYTMDTLPKPKNSDVKIREVPEISFIVIQFSGANSPENIIEHENQLIGHIKSNKIDIVGSAKYAFYNPPWTLPFMRRNEIMFELNKSK